MPSCWAGLSLAQTGINLFYNQDRHGDLWLLIVLSCSSAGAVFCNQQKPRERRQRAQRAAGGTAWRGVLEGEANSKVGDGRAPGPCCVADGSQPPWASGAGGLVLRCISCHHCLHSCYSSLLLVFAVCVQWQQGQRCLGSGLVSFARLSAGDAARLPPARPASRCLHSAAAIKLPPCGFAHRAQLGAEQKQMLKHCSARCGVRVQPAPSFLCLQILRPEEELESIRGCCAVHWVLPAER